MWRSRDSNNNDMRRTSEPEPVVSAGVDNYQDLVDTTGPFDATRDGFLVKYNDSTGNMELVDPATLFTDTDTNQLRNLLDVDVLPLTIAEDGFLLSYDHVTGDFVLIDPATVGGGGGAHALNGHTDTNLGSPGAGADGYLVGWDNASSKYTLKAPSAPGAHTLVSHSDVNITPGAGVDGYVITYDHASGDFILSVGPAAAPHTLDSHSNVDTAGKANGDFLKWDNGAGKWVDQTLNMQSWLTGNPGAAGQIPVSNGSGAAATWTPLSLSALGSSINAVHRGVMLKDLTTTVFSYGTSYGVQINTSGAGIKYLSLTANSVVRLYALVSVTQSAGAVGNYDLIATIQRYANTGVPYSGNENYGTVKVPVYLGGGGSYTAQLYVVTPPMVALNGDYFVAGAFSPGGGSLLSLSYINFGIEVLQ